jgi:hypothetical protein
VSGASKYGRGNELPLIKPMKKLLYVICAVLITSLTCRAGSAEQEKAFTDKYKTAFEAKDTATLEPFLYTQGSDPAILEFYKKMESSEAGRKFRRSSLLISPRMT